MLRVGGTGAGRLPCKDQGSRPASPPHGGGVRLPKMGVVPTGHKEGGTPHPSCCLSVLASQERVGDQVVFEAPSSSVLWLSA